MPDFKLDFNVAETRRAEDLLTSVLAALSLKGVDILRTTDKSFHAQFGAALEVFKAAGGELRELAADYYLNVVSKTYDELDHALIAAEQFGIVKFPNPSYSHLQITIPKRTAEEVLQEWGDDREVIERAAQTILENI